MIETQAENSLNKQKTDTISVVFFGRLEERKGLCTFVEAINLLEPELQNKIKITFMGKVVPLYSAELKHLNSEQYIEKQLEKNWDYEIIGNFYSQQAIEYINNLDHPLVCLASPQENFPNTALEMGQLPVSLIVSDTGGFHETLQLVQRSEGLYWFKPKDADSLAEMLQKAIANHPETPSVAAKSTLAEINQKLLAEKIAHIEKAFEEIKPSQKPHGKVTIGIISENQGQYLVDCLRSLEAQTYENIEVIVIDDDSKDDKSQDQFLHAQSLFPNYKFIQQQTSKGKGVLCNHILEIASGDYFLCFNPQVTLSPMAIEKFMETACNNDAAIVTCAQKQVGAVDDIVSYSGGTLPTMMNANVYGGECCLFTRALLEKFPYTEDKTINSQSWEITSAALVTGEKIVYYPYPLYEYLVTSESLDQKEFSPREKYSLRQYLAQIPPSQWTSRQIYMLLTAVQQLQDMESQKEMLLNQQVKYNQELQKWTQELQEWIKDLERAKKYLETQVKSITEQLEISNSCYQELQKWTQELQKGKDWLEQQLKSTQKGKDWLEQQLKSTKEQLQFTNQNLHSKIEQLEYVQAEIEAMKSSKFWKLRNQWFSFKKKIGLPTNE